MLNSCSLNSISNIPFTNVDITNIHHTTTKDNHDFDSLTKFLKENGVSDKDINTLENLIEIEGEVNVKTGYGKKVKEWITYLVSKSTQ